ncbi:MFS transporter [Paraurantiacibacter namhicola]|uniref:Putative MFS-type transporter YhjX n=1 Tax=Paraurantiacibacter namhicola TaxID=645517 RepID=A0A1C7DAE1_9SPHN|nr:MFS transporter [Paraurantiacibacter namhicola]ANU08424.1 putative MFS-type transporter YhjX [Paraurantiacibacter namhicola]
MSSAAGWHELRGGWTLLVACAVGVGLSAIALPFYAIGPLTRPIEAELGWARADIQLAILFSSGLGALTAPVTGWMIDRFGARRVALPSILGVSLGLLVASYASTLAIFYLGFAATAILGAGTNPVLWSRVVSGSFEKARGAALGLALVGTALVALLLPSLIVALEAYGGWRIALRGTALLPVMIALPLVWVWLRPDARRRAGDGASAGLPGVTVGEALRDYRFWVLALSILLGYLAISGTLTNLVPALIDRGIEAQAAAAFAGAVGITMIPGRVLVGFVVDRIWAPGVAMVVLLLPAAACLVLQDAMAPAILIASCAILGLAAGAELDLLAFLTARYFGLAHYSKIYALAYAGLAMGSATAPFLFASLHDRTGSYGTSFLVAGTFFAIAALLMPLLGRYPDTFVDDRSSAT